MRLACTLAFAALLLAPACSRDDEARGVAAASDPAAPAAVTAPAPPLPVGNAGHDYACSDGTTFHARIDKGNAVVDVEGNTLTLTHSEQASGAQYTGEGVTFIAQGNEALLARAGSATVRCTAK